MLHEWLTSTHKTHEREKDEKTEKYLGESERGDVARKEGLRVKKRGWRGLKGKD